MLPIRRIDLAGFTGDEDWTDPANPPPQSAKRLVATAGRMVFAMVGKESTEDDAAVEDVGDLTVDAWLGMDVDGAIVRHASVSESSGDPVSPRLLVVEEDIEPGRTYRLNIASVSGSGPGALWIYLISGARKL